MTTHYALLSDLKSVIVTNVSNSDARLNMLIEQASAEIERIGQRRYDRYVQTRLYTHAALVDRGDLIDSKTVLLDADLSELSTDPGLTLLPRNAANGYSMAYFEDGWSADDLNSDSLIEIHGVWGWGGKWSSVETLSATVGIADTDFTAADGTTYEAYMLIRMTNEIMLVTDVSTNTVTVTRAYNGSTAVEHVNPAITKFVPHPLVTAYTIRWVEWIMDVQRSPSGNVFSPTGDESVPTSSGAGPLDVYYGMRNRGISKSMRPYAV